MLWVKPMWYDDKLYAAFAAKRRFRTAAANSQQPSWNMVHRCSELNGCSCHSTPRAALTTQLSATTNHKYKLVCPSRRS